MKYIAFLIAFTHYFDFETGVDQPSTSFASFSIVENGHRQDLIFNSEKNLIFAELYSDNTMWIRFARDPEERGEKSPHIDLDLCNFSGAGVYQAIDPRKRPCGEVQGWDIWWHSDEKTFHNQTTSDPCILTLIIDGEILSGKFECSGLVEFDGKQLIEVKEGSFKTVITRK